MAIKDIDRGFNKIRKSMKVADGLKAQAGIQGSDAQAPHDAFGNRNVDVAVFNEFGTATIPERSFIRATFDRERPKYQRLMDRAVAQGLDGKGMDRAFGRLALLMAADMKRTIDQSIELKPLAASTLRARPGGTGRPLLDTGQLKRSITGVVTK